MDIITEVLKRVFNEVKDEVTEVSRVGIAIYLSIAFVVTLILPWFVPAIAVVLFWAWLFYDHYESVVVIETEDHEEKVDTEDNK